MKKALAILFSIIFLALGLTVTSFAKQESDTALKFGNDGKFKILLFADSQDDETLAESTTALMSAAIKRNNPDLVIFLGDNTVANGLEKQKEAIDALLAPCIESGTPFAIVFGNHDQEHEVDKETLLEIYQSYGCLTYDAEPDIYGCGNCNLPILSSDGKKTAFNLWLIDSGSDNPDEGTGGYDYVREDQLNWYKDTAAKLKEENGGTLVPSLKFQHVQLCETYEAIGMAKIPFGLKEYSVDGQIYFPLPTLWGFEGMMFEIPSPPRTNGGQFEAMKETGDVLGIFFGHDHVNDFKTTLDGIDMITVPTIGAQSYNNRASRGVGVITLDEANLTEYNYHVDYYSELATGDCPELLEVEDADSKLKYTLANWERKLILFINGIFN